MIDIKNISKRYQLGTCNGSRYRTLREDLASLLSRCFNRDQSERDSRGFWALQNVSLKINPGEVVGIIGRNGAGKSTLLKIITQITRPTRGEVDLYGRVGSLLEVGTGFHSELTGRENVYLNGAILGMSTREVRRKFDDIVDFAGVERFLDTPVKRYSSGMRVRLAFAVAAHLDPEILVIDEVLAVGDAEFQRRCLTKMKDVATSGRTILFVSHNMAAMMNLCQRGILLEAGRVQADGPIDAVAADYLKLAPRNPAACYDLSNVPRSRGRMALFQRVTICDSQLHPVTMFPCGAEMRIVFELNLPDRLTRPQIGIGIDTGWGQRICSVATYFSKDELPPLEGRVRVECRIPELPLAPGDYSLSLSIGQLQEPLLDQVRDVVEIQMVDTDYFGNGRLPDEELGRTLVKSCWRLSASYDEQASAA